MALINLNKKRKTSGSYYRIIGDDTISSIFTAVHAASISTGTQVSERLKLSYNGKLPIFDGSSVNSPTKTLKVIKNHPQGVIIFNGFIKNKKGKKQEIDVLIYDGVKINLYEIKDGDNLDTKKSMVEIDGIEYAIGYFNEIGFECFGGLVLMHMSNNHHSVKDLRSNNYVISGKNFCEDYSFDFESFKLFQENEVLINKEIVLNEFKKILEREGRL